MKLYISILFSILIIFCAITSCKKDNSHDKASTPLILRDTIITLENANATPVRISFTDSNYLDFTFISNIGENRCPTCIDGQHDTCFHPGVTSVYFQVTNELGQPSTFSPIFNSCETYIDTARRYFYIPFRGHYTVYPISLNPYPTSNGAATSPYTLTLYIKQN